LRTKWGKLPYLLLMVAALILLLAGVFLGLEPWATAIMVAVPVGMALVFALLARRTHDIEDAGAQITSRNAVSEGEAVIEAPVADLPTIVQRAVGGMRRFRILHVSGQGARIKASWTLKTWGEDISLTFEDIDSRSSRISAVCTPTYSPTIIDYGQGASDLHHLLQEIRKQTGPLPKLTTEADH
jgi:hypothetical protein